MPAPRETFLTRKYPDIPVFGAVAFGNEEWAERVVARLEERKSSSPPGSMNPLHVEQPCHKCTSSTTTVDLLSGHALCPPCAATMMEIVPETSAGEFFGYPDTNTALPRVLVYKYYGSKKRSPYGGPTARPQNLYDINHLEVFMQRMYGGPDGWAHEAKKRTEARPNAKRRYTGEPVPQERRLPRSAVLAELWSSNGTKSSKFGLFQFAPLAEMFSVARSMVWAKRQSFFAGFGEEVDVLLDGELKDRRNTKLRAMDGWPEPRPTRAYRALGVQTCVTCDKPCGRTKYCYGCGGQAAANRKCFVCRLVLPPTEFRKTELRKGRQRNDVRCTDCSRGASAPHIRAQKLVLYSDLNACNRDVHLLEGIGGAHGEVGDVDVDVEGEGEGDDGDDDEDDEEEDGGGGRCG